MKSFFRIIVILFVFICCERITPPTNRKYDSTLNEEKSHLVTFAMLNDIVSSKMLSTRSSSHSYSVEAYTDSSQDTLMYIVNYGKDEGWQVYSTDTRTPAILAESESGCFSLENGSEAFRIWIRFMARDIKNVRNSRDNQLSFSTEEIAAYRSFWQNVPSRGLFPPEEPWDGGQWHEGSTYEEEVIDSLEHIIVTEWDQNNPYNYYCPLKSDDPVNRTPAGCAAVAGAQMLYFLHSKYGEPAMIPSGVFWNGNEPEFVNPSAAMWAIMGTTNETTYSPIYSVPESVLIFYVGSLLNTSYGDSSSWAWDGLLDNRVFEELGFECSYDSYNETDVKNSLLDGNPVVVEAKSSILPWTGHTFIIDGYKKTRIHTTTYHYYADSEGSIIPGYPDYFTHSYTDPEITKIKMNWGWYTQWESPRKNDGWYTLTDGWTVNEGVSNEATYQYYRHIYHSFSLSNN